MKKISNIIAICVLLLSVAFNCIGYAALTDSLFVSGTAQVKQPRKVLVSKAQIVAEESSATIDVTYRGGTDGIENPAGILNTTLDFSSGSKVVLSVSVFNNTDYDYVYKGAEAPKIEGDSVNTGYSYSVSGITAESNREYGTPLTKGSTVTFTVTFTSSSSAIAYSALRFNFGYASDEEKDKAVVDNAIDAFKEALNNTELDADGDTVYDNILDEMATESDKKHSTDYIGNVVGATGGDSDFINSLFTVEHPDGTTSNTLTITIDNVVTNVTVMVKAKNIDYAHDANGNIIMNNNSPTFDNSDDEMILYMTPDKITGSSFLGANSSTTVTVYSVIFTRVNGTWVQRGEMFKGKANTNLYYTTDNYSGFLRYDCDSFNTETWVSTVNYYGAVSGSNVEEINEAYMKAQE